MLPRAGVWRRRGEEPLLVSGSVSPLMVGFVSAW